MGFPFEKLDVYQRAVGLAEAVEEPAEATARGQFHMTSQLRRAALSISLNIAEGSGRWHTKDKKQFYLIARGSAYECVPVLQVMRKRHLIDDPAYNHLRNEIERIAQMLTKLIQSLKG